MHGLEEEERDSAEKKWALAGAPSPACAAGAGALRSPAGDLRAPAQFGVSLYLWQLREVASEELFL